MAWQGPAAARQVPSDPIDSPDFQECILEDATACVALRQRGPARYRIMAFQQCCNPLVNVWISSPLLCRAGCMYHQPMYCTTRCISQTTWSQSIPPSTAMYPTSPRSFEGW